jgi:putative redox protein
VILNGERPGHGYPRPYKKIHMKYLLVGTELDKKKVLTAIDESMKKFCHVGATLSGTAELSHSYEIEEA